MPWLRAFLAINIHGDTFIDSTTSGLMCCCSMVFCSKLCSWGIEERNTSKQFFTCECASLSSVFPLPTDKFVFPFVRQVFNLRYFFFFFCDSMSSWLVKIQLFLPRMFSKNDQGLVTWLKVRGSDSVSFSSQALYCCQGYKVMLTMISYFHHLHFCSSQMLILSLHAKLGCVHECQLEWIKLQTKFYLSAFRAECNPVIVECACSNWHVR